MKNSPPSLVPHWWRRGLDDGRHCEAKRREHWFRDYLESAELELTDAGLLPAELVGPFTLLYRKAFRLGYDNAALQRARDTVLPRFKRRAKLAK